MKNLKRLLSLALTGVMLVGMMAIGASAVEYKDFADVSEIENTEAVSTMVALGVINGKDDGSFDPTGSVTRAEMAKMITVTLFGGTDPNLGTTASGSFTDTRGNWAESYIEYCASQGIIAGVGSNMFNPAGNVTGQQAAKMLLVTIGRNADAFGYIGNDWALNTMGDAITFGLFEELTDIDPSAPLTREDAAQMIYNALDVYLWERAPQLNLATGVVTNGYAQSGTKTLLNTNFKVNTTYGVLTTIDEDNLQVVEGLTGYTSDVPGDTSFDNLQTDYSDLLGQAVKVMYRMVKNEKVVLGVAPMGMNKTITVPMNEVENKDAKIKVDGTTYTMNNSGTTTANNKISAIVDGAAAEDWTSANFASTGTNTSMVTFVDNNNDGWLEYAVVTSVTVGKVIYTSSSSIVAGSNTYTFEDDNIASGIAKDDYVAASKNLFTGHYDVTEIEPIEATIKGTKTGNQYLLNGEWLTALAASTLTGSPAAGDDVKYYTVNNVIVAGEKIEGAANIDNLVMVIDADVAGTSGSLLNRYVRILHTDGSKETVKIDPSDNVITASSKGELYTFKTSDEGYKFTAVAADIGNYTWVAGASTDVTANGDGEVEKIGGKTVADDAVIFVYSSTDKDATVITGKDLKSLALTTVNTTSKGSFTSVVNALTRVSIAAIEATGKLPTIGAAGDLKYGFVVSAPYTSGTSEITYTVWDGEKNVEVTEDISGGAVTRTEKAFYSFKINENNEISNVTALSLTAKATRGIEGDKVTFDGSTLATLDEKIVYIYVDSAADADKMGIVAGELQPATEVVSGVFVNNVLVESTGSGDSEKVTLMVVDVKNVLDASLTEVSTYTGTLTGDSKTSFTESSVSAHKLGDTVTIEYTLTETGTSSTKITLSGTGAQFTDGTTTLSLDGVAAGTYTVTVVVGTANWTATLTD